MALSTWVAESQNLTSDKQLGAFVVQTERSDQIKVEANQRESTIASQFTELLQLNPSEFLHETPNRGVYTPRFL